MATATTSAENQLVIMVGKLHPDYTVSVFQPVNEVYPYLHVFNGKYEVNTQIRLAKHHWDVPTLDRLATKSIKEIERVAELAAKREATPPKRK